MTQAGVRENIQGTNKVLRYKQEMRDETKASKWLNHAPNKADVVVRLEGLETGPLSVDVRTSASVANITTRDVPESSKHLAPPSFTAKSVLRSDDPSEVPVDDNGFAKAVSRRHRHRYRSRRCTLLQECLYTQLQYLWSSSYFGNCVQHAGRQLSRMTYQSTPNYPRSLFARYMIT